MARTWPKQVVDAQQKLGALGTAQAELEPVTNQISTLQSELESARDGLRALKQDEDDLAAQERRFADLAHSSRDLAVDIAQRLETVQGLQAELGKAATLKEELLGEPRARRDRRAGGGEAVRLRYGQDADRRSARQRNRPQLRQARVQETSLIKTASVERLRR